MVKSLRWRLQVWHAVVLMAVVTIFGAIVYELQWQTRLQQIDAELDRTAEVVISQLRRLLPWPGPFPRPGRWPAFVRPDDSTSRGEAIGPRREETRPEGMPPPARNEGRSDGRRGDRGRDGGVGRGGRPWNSWQPPFGGFPGFNPTPGTPGLGLPDEFLQLFQGEEAESRLYFMIWDREGKPLQKSDSAPTIVFPNLHIGKDEIPVRTVRLRDDHREVIHVSRFDINVLVGRSIRRDLAEQHRSGVLLAFAGLGVLAAGLVGGWWLSSRAIRPIASMTVAADAISVRNLSERIDLQETDSELGQLGSVLNRTFDRLQSAFEQQSRFTADASHELRTPLSVILANSELALSRPRSSEEYRAALETCRRASQRMKSLIDCLLMLARCDSGNSALEPRELDLEPVAKECLELMRPLAEERHIRLEATTAPTCVYGDRDRVSQVLTNLLSNAIRYNHDGGQVHVGVAAENGAAVLTVTDTGMGIPPDALPHIFDRFYRVDEARSRSEGGSGLGLAICKTIVEAHGGTITARGEPQGGTTIEVRLPRRESEVPEMMNVE